MTHKTFFKLIILSLFMDCNLISTVYATDPAEEAIRRQQQMLQQQQEQRRQFEQNQQNLQETTNIRKNSIRNNATGNEQTNIGDNTSTGQLGQCEIAYRECVNQCNQTIDAQNKQGISKCTQQCMQTRNTCIAEVEANCPIHLQQIILRGNEVYTIQTLQEWVTNKFLHKCLNKANILALQSELTNFYVKRGYTMARVYFDMNHLLYNKVHDPKTGKETTQATFIIVIEEGKVYDITLNTISAHQVTEKEKRLSELYAQYQTLKVKQQELSTQHAESELSSIQESLNILAPQLKQLALEVKQEETAKRQKSSSKWAKFRQSGKIFFAFPFRKYRVYNMRDFEQGLNQLNRLQSNNVTMDIRPSTRTTTSDSRLLSSGYSDIILNNNQDPLNKGVPTGSRTTFLTANYRNSGSKSTGENVVNFSLSKDNLLSFNDNIYLSYTETSNSLFPSSNNKIHDPNDPANKNPFHNKLDYFNNDDHKLRYSKSLYTSISIPLGYWTLTGGLNYSTYKTINSGLYTTFHTTGQTLTKSYTLDRVMYHTQKYKLNFGSSLEIRDTESYIRDLKSETGSKKTTSHNLYLNNIIYTKLGTLIIKPSYQRGLPWFGAKMDAAVYGGTDISNLEPRLQYSLFKLYVYYNTRINLPLLTTTTINNPDGTLAQDDTRKNHRIRNKLPLTYALTIDSQYSLDTLYGADQFSVGGEYTVRGFRESTISGDHGFYLRNDFKVNLSHVFAGLLAGKSSAQPESISPFKTKVFSLLSKTSLTVFYDYGYVKNKYISSSDLEYNAGHGWLSGLGVGLTYSGKFLDWSLIYSQALHSPKYLQTRDGLAKEQQSIYWKIGMSW